MTKLLHLHIQSCKEDCPYLILLRATARSSVELSRKSDYGMCIKTSKEIDLATIAIPEWCPLDDET
jgi:hypothetical protein